VGVLSALHGERRLARARARGPLEAFVVAPSLARALAAESAVLRNFFDGVVRERVLALLPHVSRTLARMERAACMRLLELCEVLSVADGTLLQLEGVAARSLYLVAVGEAEIFGEPIAARIVQRAGAGDLIGAESLRDDTAARSTVRASRPMMVARLSRANYRRFAAEHSAAAQLLRETERE
jgi:hypothetical protein